MWYIYIHIGHTLSHRKEGNLPICDYMDGPLGYYAEWSKSDRERQIVYELTSLWNLKDKNQIRRYRE